MVLSSGDKILFAGDSITDCGSRRGGEAHPLGDGYVRIFAELMSACRPDLEAEVVNKGVGGNTVIDLRGRWEKDVLDQKPDWLAVMIGINDIHCHLRGVESGVHPDVFMREYRALIGMAAEKLKCRFIILDAFYISSDGGGDPFRQSVIQQLPEYIAVSGKIAEGYGAVHIKTNDLFRLHLKHRPPDFFAPEPVHPNSAGHTVIAWELAKALLF